MSRLSKVLELQSRIEDDSQKISALNDEKKATEERVAAYRSAVYEIPLLQQTGRGWFIAGIVLIVLEIILLVGFNNFSFLDIVIIAVPFIVGLVKRNHAKKEIAKLLGNAADLSQLQQDLQDQQTRIEQINNELDVLDQKLEPLADELEELVKYTGKNWDVANMQMTPDAVRQMEKDTVDMLYHLTFAENGTEDYLTKCWLFQGFSATVRLSGDQERIDQCKRFQDNLSDSESWMLKIFNFAQWLYSLEMLNTMMQALGGAEKEHMVLSDMLLEREYRIAQTPLEDEFIQILPLAFQRVGGIVHMGDMDQFRM